MADQVLSVSGVPAGSAASEMSTRSVQECILPIALDQRRPACTIQASFTPKRRQAIHPNGP
jgi:hypothetical protein